MSKGLKKALIVIACVVAGLFVISNLNADVSGWLSDGKDILFGMFIPGTTTP